MKLVNTEIILSQVNARDGIFIDFVNQDYKESSLTFIGDVKGELLGLPEGYRRFLLVFSVVSYYSCVDLDFSEVDAQSVSNFNIIQDSEYIRLNQLIGFNHYYLSSYDYAYEIIAKEVNFQFNSPKE